MMLTDEAFVAAVETCTLPNEQFRHREHLRLAWLYLRESPCAVAERRMACTIRRYATHHGAPEKYHQTITLLWMRLVAAARAKTPNVSSFDAFGDAHPSLLDKMTVHRFYSAARLNASDARAGWVDPDLLPLP